MDRWDHLDLTLQVLAVDPAGVGGLWLRGRAGPLRDLATARLAAMPAAPDRPTRRLSLAVDDAALMGGLDPAATLAAGRPVHRPGLLADPARLILPMAESAPAGLVARLAQALDTGQHSLIALDEAAEAGEGLAPALADRLGLFVDLDGLRAPDDNTPPLPASRWIEARARLATVQCPPEAARALVTAAARLGVASDRAVLLCLRVARALAALNAHPVITDTDLARAAALSLAHRAALADDLADDLPDDQDAPPPEPPPEAEAPQDTAEDRPDDAPLADRLVEAARAVLPADLLAHLAAGRAARSARGASGSGAVKVGNRRGRPLPSRAGHPDGRRRIDLVATLRAAAPWQALRRRTAPASSTPRALYVTQADLRLRRHQEHTDRVLIFAVDASGSSAMARLAEAKGAVELLLTQAYSRRDQVALVVFRGPKAELLLPPTRSLVRTKARLRGVPGGGGTPLASGLAVALACAVQARRRGMTPSLAILTDGRGNIALDGRADRPQAALDAQAVARAIRAAEVPGVVLDVATRPQPALAELSRLMNSRYVPLPRADAARIAATLG